MRFLGRWRCALAAWQRTCDPVRVCIHSPAGACASNQLAEVLDVFWAPLSALLVFQLYGNSLLSGVALVEELLPFTDIFPTATVGWILQYTVGARSRFFLQCPRQCKQMLLHRTSRTRISSSRFSLVSLCACH